MAQEAEVWSTLCAVPRLNAQAVEVLRLVAEFGVPFVTPVPSTQNDDLELDLSGVVYRSATHEILEQHVYVHHQRFSQWYLRTISTATLRLLTTTSRPCKPVLTDTHVLWRHDDNVWCSVYDLATDLTSTSRIPESKVRDLAYPGYHTVGGYRDVLVMFHEMAREVVAYRVPAFQLVWWCHAFPSTLWTHKGLVGMVCTKRRGRCNVAIDGDGLNVDLPNDLPETPRDYEWKVRIPSSYQRELHRLTPDEYEWQFRDVQTGRRLREADLPAPLLSPDAKIFVHRDRNFLRVGPYCFR